MTSKNTDNLLDRLIADAQADDYALAGRPGGRHVGVLGWVVFVVIGVLLVAAFLQRQDVQPAAAQRRAELTQRIEASSARVAQAQTTAAQLRGSVSQLQQLATRGLGDDFAEQVQAVEAASGFVGLVGPGAVVTLRDGAQPLPKGVTEDEARVLDIDMQMVVNGLWQAGASAIAINGIRLTSVTAIRTAGEAIVVDFRPLVPPYTIDAIGPEDLAAEFERTPASEELAQLGIDYGIQSKVSQAKEVSVPASTANLPTRAEVVKGGQR